MNIKPLAFIAFLFSFLFVSCGGRLGPVATDVPATEPVQSRAIVIGDISDDPAEVIEGTQPLADYLASNLSEYGITEGQVQIATSTEELAQLLADGKVDLYFDSTYPATLISAWTYEALGEYRSQFELVSLGQVPIRGNTEPIEIWAVRKKL